MDYSDIYGLRTLVFIESEPQSNKYHQVFLTQKQYYELTRLISKGINKLDGNIEETEIEVSDTEYNLPDLQDVKIDL